VVFVLKCKEFLANFVWTISKTFFFSWVLHVLVVDLLFLLPGEFYTPISSNSQTVPQVRSKEICQAMSGGVHTLLFNSWICTERERVGGGALGFMSTGNQSPCFRSIHTACLRTYLLFLLYNSFVHKNFMFPREVS
jgi:hypothetical protein